ncbi:class I SAM-dependent methyltransferase [Mesorhizobium escarrei]|uniref:Methyltransferase type 11 domain-containing protein n=1 Tax=Mesorhizobium escarrei TaxID=666018 RepID=A0ABM9E1T5_9HYPH|nr:class I SAM-dependent methyltransferase [Mesorhizobium escarrei]CAH2403028.1 hypothetical protein MES5069_360120 [Mesorhizobium escarrei]
MTGPDEWSNWFQYSRFGRTTDRDDALQIVFDVRDRLLAIAPLREIDSLLDFGCGDGLIGLQAALETPPHSRIYFADQSESALDLCRENARRMNIESRCRYLHTDCRDTYPFGNISVECILSRAAIMYVEDKSRLLASFYYILKNGGHLCFCEPINKFRMSPSTSILSDYELPRWQSEIKRIYEILCSSQRKSANLMCEIAPEDIVQWLEDAGFQDIVCFAEYRSLVGRPGWNELLYVRANPFTPSLFEAAQDVMDLNAWKMFEAELHAEWNRRNVRRRAALLFCKARKG